MEPSSQDNDKNNGDGNNTAPGDVENDLEDEPEDRKLSPAEAAALEMMKQQASSDINNNNNNNNNNATDVVAAAVATANTSSSSTTTTTNRKKKNAKKKKKAGAEGVAAAAATTITQDAPTTAAAAAAAAAATLLPPEQQLQQLKLASVENGQLHGDMENTHAFWNTQPMPHTGTDHPEGPIQPNKTLEEIRNTPYNMPTGFAWSNVDVTDTAQRNELYDLLANNYVEDDECLFRFDYSSDFLLWALTPPEFNPDFLLGVRTTSNAKLVAFISGIPTRIQAYDQQISVVEINFLCVHKKLRSKRLAPVLIREITRRVNITGIFQAVYTAGVVLPVPVSSARYHHRSLNPKKLVRVGFSQLHPRMTLARMQKLYKLPSNIQSTALRPMEPEDVPGVHELLTTYLSKFKLKVMFTPEEVGHWLLPRERVINSFVLEGKNTNNDNHGGNSTNNNNNTRKITDLISFYHLPSSILGHDDTLFAGYSFYNVATSVPLVDLMRDALILARNLGSDVFNALTLMDNTEFLTELKFGKGDGNLQYYVYNWACPRMEAPDVGIVLL